MATTLQGKNKIFHAWRSVGMLLRMERLWCRNPGSPELRRDHFAVLRSFSLSSPNLLFIKVFFFFGSLWWKFSRKIWIYYIWFLRRRNSDAESECWSDDSGSEYLSRTLSNNSSRGWDVISEDELENEHGNAKLGNLYLHYVDTGSPYCRPPLVDKVIN